MKEIKPIVTIVICTYNRAELLSDALDSLTKQSADISLFSILIVNNNSSDNTQEVAQEFVQNNSNSRLVTESQQGLSYARNRGYLEAECEWVAYMDDDACAFNNFIERMIYVIENYNFDCFGGIFLPWYKYGKPAWFKDAYGTSRYILNRTGVLERGFVSGGNIVIKKSVLKKLCGFDTNIGMSGKKVSYGEETQLQVRMRKLGYTIGFDPALKIDHLVNTYKQTPFWYIKSSYASGRDYWITQQLDPTWPILIRMFLGASKNLIKEFAYKTPKLIKKNYYIQNWLIDTFRHFSYTIGCIHMGINTILKNMQRNK